MATVPSGWAYWDKSANKRIVAGGTIPTPAEGDEYFGVTSSGATDYSKLFYIYYNSETRNYVNQNSNVQQTTFTLPAGWHVTNQSYTMTSATVASSIGGENVVAVKIYNNTVSKITSLSLPNTVVMVWLDDNSNLTTITGSLGSALKEFLCYRSPKLESVPTLANATNLTNCSYMFNQCTTLTTIPALPPNAVSLYYAFHLCTSLTSIPTIPSKVKDMAYLCEGCTALTAAPSNNSAVILYMERAFADCTNLTNASNFSIPNTVELGWELFRNCSKLTQIPTVISGTNANYNGIFRECSLLNAVPTFSGSFTQLINAFRECVSLTTPPIIKNILNCDMGYMFYGCTSLTTIPVLPKTMLSAYYMFYNCTSLMWASIIIPAHSNPPSINYMFAGCSNLTGVIWKKGDYNNAHNNTFLDTVQPIILAGENIDSTGPSLAATANNHNVYIGLNTTISESGIARCDATGTLDDKGNYAKLTIKFNCSYLPNSKIYVPKVYIKNAQQQPIQDWTLTYVNNLDETIVKTITNSTDITQEHIEANDLITSGTFETIFNAVDDSVYTIYIPTSCSQVAQDYDTDGNYVVNTYYWNGTRGQAIFTGDTYIFDALPDGSCFKIGGPIIENNGDTGFIVGNEVSLLSAQYKSTFNGPVTVNGTIANKGLGLQYHNIFSSINAISINNDVNNTFTVDWQGNVMAQGMAGMVQMYAGAGTQTVTDGVATTTNLPLGWLICDGSSLLIEEYPELAAALWDGTAYIYGAVDSTHFNLPDFRGRAPVGAGQGSGLTNRSLGTPGGDENIQAHTHGFTAPSYTTVGAGSHNHVPATANRVFVTTSDDVASGNFTRHSVKPGSGTAVTNLLSSKTVVGWGTVTNTVAAHSHTVNHTSGTGSVNAVSGALTGSAGNMMPYLGINYIIATGKTSY